MTRWWAMVIGMTLGTASALPADDLGMVPPGTRLRVTLIKNDVPLVGAMVSVEDGHLVVDAPSPGLMTVPLSEVFRLEVSRGRKSRWLAGAAVGTLGGPAVACALTRPCLGRGTVVLAGLTGTAGGLIGRALKSERWEEARRPTARANVVATPRHGVSVSISIGF